MMQSEFDAANVALHELQIKEIRSFWYTATLRPDTLSDK